MKAIMSAGTDVGITKKVNQDSALLRYMCTDCGNVVFIAVCDGISGLEMGETASAGVIGAFDKWSLCELPYIDVRDSESVKSQFIRIIDNQNTFLQTYGGERGIRLGTTVTAMLITDTYYCIANVGDSRVYHICEDVRCITKDQTYMDSNILMQCVGAEGSVKPDVYIDRVHDRAVYVVCSDGFRNRISEYEMLQYLNPERLSDNDSIHNNIRQLIELNKCRNERDNITAVAVKIG